jgi:hypothetical protein
VTIPTQAKFQAAGLRKHVGAWQEVTKDHICLQAISGVKIPLLSTPPIRLATKEELGRREADPVVDEAIRELIRAGGHPDRAEGLPEQGVHGGQDRAWEGVWTEIHSKSESEFS